MFPLNLKSDIEIESSNLIPPFTLMGCVTSTLLNQDEEFPQIGAFSHHIVSLTSTTYGLLSLDPTPPPPASSDSPPRKRGGSMRHPPLETINSWDLMSGLDENVNPNIIQPSLDDFLEKFETICPPNGENRVVMYSTSLRGVRKTFEDCNAVRSAIHGLGVSICERDISMDRGFRDELTELMKGKGGKEALIPPKVFVKGRYVGGVEEVMKIADQGYIGKLVEGLPKLKGGCVCEGCGGVGFLPCFRCHGSCKLVKKSVVLRCSDCNENGLVLCPLCS